MPETTQQTTSFRQRWTGTVQDVCAALTMLAFILGASFWLAVLS